MREPGPEGNAVRSCRGSEMNLFTSSRACLAPMAGYSDAPFRLICSEFGADFCVTEMVSADGLARGGEKTRRLLARMEGEAPLGVQLFGSDPSAMAEAASIAEETGPAFIDLNFGCPVKKVIRRNGGAAVMRDLGLMERLCAAVAGAVDIPVTAKIRSGWSRDESNYIEAGRVLEGAGCGSVAIHPRYRSQGFSGEADWSHIARLREALSIPVIANGDVTSVEDYNKIVYETGCTLVMIGRGAFGRPWIFREIADDLDGREPKAVGPGERIGLLERFVRMEVEWKGERLGILEMRKFYRWYVRGHPGMKEYRCRLSTACSMDEVLDILSDLREEIDTRWRKPA